MQNIWAFLEHQDLSLFSPVLVPEERSPPLLTGVCVWVAGDLLETDGERTAYSYPHG